MRRYDRLTLALPADEEEALCAELWSLGSVGMECRDGSAETIVEAYFEAGESRAPSGPAADWSERGIRIVDTTALPEKDWLAAYRLSAAPFRVGRGWLIDPGEPARQVPTEPGRVTLRLPARRAFGTGSHESTRLVLEWLEDLPVAGRRVLDLGTGSGVLSLAARHLGAISALGLDLDPVATVMARDTCRLNGAVYGIVAGTVDCLAGGRFDLALVNIVPAAWLRGVDALAALLEAGSMTIFSGVLNEQLEEFSTVVESAGFHLQESREAGDWVALKAGIDGAGERRSH